MKLFIASDIHGSAYYCEKMLEAREREGSPRMLLLGDLLYHGPRNDLPEDYAPKKVIAMLNPLKDDIFCVRGNCEAEVDQMVLDFPVMADYCLLPLISRKKAEDGGDGILYDTGHVMFCTHGHVWHEKNLPPLRPGDLLLEGRRYHDSQSGVRVDSQGGQRAQLRSPGGRDFFPEDARGRDLS